MKKLAVIAVAALMMAACGGRGLDGTYEVADSNAENGLLVISGNKMQTMQDGKVLDDITFKLVEQSKEKGVIRGIIDMTTANGDKYEEKYELDGNRLSMWGTVFTKQNTTPPKVAKSKRGSVFGGENGIIIMKAEGYYVKLILNGTATIDWGDGNSVTHEFGKEGDRISKSYSDFTERTITITGKNMTYMDCPDSRVTFLDVSKNTALLALCCVENELTSLDLSKNTKLEELICADNGLKSLDLSKNIKLKSLYCGENELTSLDLSKNTALLELDCNRNELTSLDVSKCSALTYLNCSHNRLLSLDLSKNTTLFELNCSGNLLNGSALDALFGSLRSSDKKKSIAIYHNPGVKDCDETIAMKKGWEVRSFQY